MYGTAIRIAVNDISATLRAISPRLLEGPSTSQHSGTSARPNTGTSRTNDLVLAIHTSKAATVHNGVSLTIRAIHTVLEKFT